MNENEIEQTVLSSKILLSMTVAEANQILSIIGKFPFEEVNVLVQRIRTEGQPQIDKIIADLTAKAKAEQEAASTTEAPPAAQ